jgi:hypothetical protein
MMNYTSKLIQPLAAGPLDVIGDIHGEIDALTALLDRLGYRADGSHPAKRHLVFVGDLCDRGPDSPAVIFKVRDLVASGRAQCVLGNHELNLLHRAHKHGNHWFLEKDDHQYQKHAQEFGPSVRVQAHQESEILQFLNTLPVALERADLRVVHAAWDSEAIRIVRQSTCSALALYQSFDEQIKASPKGKALQRAAQQQKAHHALALKDLTRHEPFTPFLHEHAEWEAFYQCSNPIRVLTSGLERVAKTPFRTAGQWRFVERVKWWQDYTDAPAVVFGHYWRFWNPQGRAQLSKGEPNLFDDNDDPLHWHKNALHREVAFCVDYSVGARYKERLTNTAVPFHGRLAALRWPEREVVFDHPE